MTNYGSPRSAPDPSRSPAGRDRFGSGLVPPSASRSRGAGQIGGPRGGGSPGTVYGQGANGNGANGRGPHGKASVYGGGAGSAWSGGSSSSRGPSGRGSSGGGTGGKPPRNSSGSRTSRPYPSGPGRTKRRTPWWATLSLVLGLLVMIAGLGGMVATKFVTGRVDSAISQVSLLAPAAGTKATSIDGAINLLMVGLDTRDNNPGMGSRSDSIIIGHIPATHDRVDLISIPRDTYVPIPAYRLSHFSGAHDKINAAFQYGSQNGQGNRGGVQLLQQTIQQNWGITFQGALIVNFDGFGDIVSQLGGVHMYVDERTESLHHGYLTANPSKHAAPWAINSDGTPNHRIPGTTPVIYTVGWHTLDAYQALDYVRCRDFLPNADYDRQRHQQQFIKALLQEAYSKGISDPLKISSFISSLGKAFQFDGGGHSTSDWIFTLKGISPGSIRTIKINGGTFNTVMVGKQSTQQMSALSLELLQDVKTDQVDNFLAVHPDWVTNS